MRCADCNKFFKAPGHFYGDRCGLNHSCQQCSKMKNKSMSNQELKDKLDELLYGELNMIQTKLLKITAEVDGKQVPLRTISTESFEAIKALEKPKEIPVARLATNRSGAPRLLFKPINNIKLDAGYLYALDLKLGICSNQWRPLVDKSEIDTYYENVKPL